MQKRRNDILALKWAKKIFLKPIVFSFECQTVISNPSLYQLGRIDLGIELTEVKKKFPTDKRTQAGLPAVVVSFATFLFFPMTG